jgi:hypothetical protein
LINLALGSGKSALRIKLASPIDFVNPNWMPGIDPFFVQYSIHVHDSLRQEGSIGD